MKNRTIYALSLVGAGITASCGYTAPYQTSGPVLSTEGVQIAVAGEQCYVNRSGEEFPTTSVDGVLHVGLMLQVTNHSDRAAVITRDGFQLEETVGSEHAVLHPDQSGSLTLSPGQSADVALDFTQGHDMELDCHHDLTLDARGAVAVEGKPVHLAGIHFLPAR